MGSITSRMLNDPFGYKKFWTSCQRIPQIGEIRTTNHNDGITIEVIGHNIDAVEGVIEIVYHYLPRDNANEHHEHGEISIDKDGNVRPRYVSKTEKKSDQYDPLTEKIPKRYKELNAFLKRYPILLIHKDDP